LKGVIF